MHDAHKKTPHARQTMDGFIGNSRRPQVGSGHHGLSSNRFHSAGNRRIGDFKRPDGFHPAPQSVISDTVQTRQQLRPNSTLPGARSQTAASAQAAQQASILNMTLPGGYAEKQQKAKRKKHDKARRGKWGTIRRWGLRSALVFGALLLVGGGYMGFQIYNKVNKVFKGGGTAAALQADVKPELLKGEGDGRINVLLLGRGGINHEGPDLTDTILVASIDPLNKTVNLVSVPRDLWVTTSGTSGSKINAVFANAKYKALYQDPKDTEKAEKAGATAIQQVVTQVLGIPLHYYGIVDFDAFKEAVDTVGGVTIDVPEDLVDYSMAWENRNNPVLAKKGVQTFNGKQALNYVRSRHGSTRGDFDRTERQRLFIQALSQKVLSSGTYTNPVKITQLMNTFGNHVSTDFSIGDLIRLTSILKGADMSKMTSIGLADPPNNYVRTDAMNNQSVVRPTAGFGDYSEIQAYIRNTLRDPYLAKENASLMVLNGTSQAGLAGTKAAELQSYGYNVTKVGDAPTQTYAKTTVVDMTAGKKPYTKNYLEKRLGVKIVTKLPDAAIQAQGADFVIILGDE